jgi:hypothetical protein
VGWSSIANHVMLGLVIKLFFILIQRRVNLLCDREKEILTWEQMQKWTLPFLNYARKNIFFHQNCFRQSPTESNNTPYGFSPIFIQKILGSIASTYL